MDIHFFRIYHPFSSVERQIKLDQCSNNLVLQVDTFYSVNSLLILQRFSKQIWCVKLCKVAVQVEQFTEAVCSINFSIAWGQRLSGNMWKFLAGLKPQHQHIIFLKFALAAKHFFRMQSFCQSEIEFVLATFCCCLYTSLHKTTSNDDMVNYKNNSKSQSGVSFVPFVFFFQVKLFHWLFAEARKDNSRNLSVLKLKKTCSRKLVLGGKALPPDTIFSE